ncbi:hypothetical protein KAU33_11010 [Candidatus Dependentiae bacterium]|nr:hypothetical protein [Candidatus Dependentiae bacterium]
MADDKKLSELTTENTAILTTKLYSVNGSTSGYTTWEKLAEQIALTGLPVTGFDDLRVPLTATKGAGVKDPNFGKYKDDGGVSTGVYIYLFDSDAENELFFSVQFPHSWKEGTNIYPHVHWIPTINGTGSQKVSWGMEYHWSNIGSIFGNTAIINSNLSSPDETLIADKHYVTNLPLISGAGKTFSSMMNCRIYRDATGAVLTDDYTSNAGLLEVDFHYEVEKFGNSTYLY